MDGIRNQKALADAAKMAGVRIFVPFKCGSSVQVEGGVVFKGQIYDHLRETRLPYALFYSGLCRILSYCP